MNASDELSENNIGEYKFEITEHAICLFRSLIKQKLKGLLEERFSTLPELFTQLPAVWKEKTATISAIIDVCIFFFFDSCRNESIYDF